MDPGVLKAGAPPFPGVVKPAESGSASRVLGHPLHGRPWGSGGAPSSPCASGLPRGGPSKSIISPSGFISGSLFITDKE